MLTATTVDVSCNTKKERAAFDRCPQFTQASGEVQRLPIHRGLTGYRIQSSGKLPPWCALSARGVIRTSRNAAALRLTPNRPVDMVDSRVLGQ
jgi:hypothetical protein